MKNKKLWSIIIILIVIIPLLYAGFKFFFKAPTIELTTLNAVDLNNNPVALDSYKKNLVVGIWATWCGTCIKEMPDLVALKQQLNAENWEVILISDEELAKITKFVEAKKYDLTFLKATDPFSQLGIKRYPTTYIFDKAGKLKFQRNGKLALFKSEFEQTIRDIEP